MTRTASTRRQRARRAFLICLFATALAATLVIGAQASSRPADSGPVVTITADGLILEWSLQPPHITATDASAAQITLPGYALTRQPGLPQVPFASILIALPSDAKPTIRILAHDERTQPLPGQLPIAPQPDGVRRDTSGTPIGGAFSPAVTAASRPLDPIVLEEVGVVRGVRLARVTFYPVRPDRQLLRTTSQLRASIAFNAISRAAYPVESDSPADPLLTTVRAAVANPEHIRPEKTSKQDSSPAPRPPSPVPPHSSLVTRHSSLTTAIFAVEVISPGLTALTYEALSASGFPVAGADPANLHVTRSGNEIAAEWDGDGDASFEPGERLLFYAEPRFSRYTAADVYFLSFEATPGLRMTTRPASPAGLPAGSAWMVATAEVNMLYTPDRLFGSLPPGRDGDRWTWDVLLFSERPAFSTRAYAIDVPAVDATQPATLRLWLIGYTDVLSSPDHRVDVSLNGAPLGRIEWNGKIAITATLPVTPGIVHDGTNTVTLTLPGLPGVAVEGMWLDAFSIHYARGQTAAGASVRFGAASITSASPSGLPHRLYLPLVMKNFSAASGAAYSVALSSPGPYRAYDVSDPDRPVQLAGVAVSGSTISIGDSTPGGPHRFVVTSEAGILAPAKVRPASSLQAGSDFAGANYVIIAPIDFTPALTGLIGLRQSQGLTVTVENVQAIYDTYGGGRPEPQAIRAYLANAYAMWPLPPTYALLVGDGTYDPKRYRATSPPTIIPPYLADVDPWAGETAADNRFVAVDGGDNLPDMLIGRLPVNTLTETHIVVNKIVQYESLPAPGDWDLGVTFVADNPDSAGEFHAQSDLLAATYITAPYTLQRIYYAPPTTTITATQQAITGNWNSGAGLIMYTGHASVHQWAAERLFHLDDVAGLSNGLKLPVVLEMTCFTGSFHDPRFATLDESLLRRPDGGAIAAWGATGLGVSTGHVDLADGFLQSVYRSRQSDLGLAALSGKLTLAARGLNLDLLDTFTLLGDPATRLSIAGVP